MGLTARDVMSSDAQVCDADDDIVAVARILAEQHVGAVPICGDDRKLQGVITDRDIVVRVIAEGRDPRQVLASDIGGGPGSVVTVHADDSIETALRTMSAEGVRRLPVIDDGELVGMIGLADVAERIHPAKVCETLRDLLVEGR